MTPKRAEGAHSGPPFSSRHLCTEVYKEKLLLKEGHLQALLNGGQQSSRVTPFWFRTRVMKKELASEARAHEPPSRPLPVPHSSPARSPAAGTLPCSYYFPPLSRPPRTPAPAPSLLRASPLRRLPQARPLPAPSLSHNSILFTETNCLASGCT